MIPLCFRIKNESKGSPEGARSSISPPHHRSILMQHQILILILISIKYIVFSDHSWHSCGTHRPKPVDLEGQSKVNCSVLFCSSCNSHDVIDNCSSAWKKCQSLSLCILTLYMTDVICMLFMLVSSLVAAPIELPYPHELGLEPVLVDSPDEKCLQQLCYLATGIQQLRIGPNGGNFTLGSPDASLEFPPGAVKQVTSVRYAIILHGPFVFPAGYKPGSVVVYLNMDGAILLQPVILFLSHWCIREEEDDEETRKFLRASHTLETGQHKYIFEEQEEEKADLTTRTNVGVLKIWEPRCLYCVEAKIEKVARYSAITFSQYIHSEDTLLFMIQFMCDSLDWNEVKYNI